MMEFLWVIMGFLWVPVGLRGPLRVTMGSLWVPMGSVRALCGVPIGVRTPRRSLCVTPQPTAPPSGGEEQLGGSCRHTQQLLSLLLDGPRGAAAFRPLPPLPPPPRDVVELPLPQRSRAPPSVQDLQRELDAVTHRLEQLRAQRPPAAPPPTPPLALPHRDTAALLTAFEATELRGPRGGRDPQLCPIGSAAPNACTALRHLGKHMEALRRLQAAAEAALRMEGERKEWESRMEALQQCHRLPPT